jgi:hypothetical protein
MVISAAKLGLKHAMLKECAAVLALCECTGRKNRTELWFNQGLAKPQK